MRWKIPCFVPKLRVTDPQPGVSAWAVPNFGTPLLSSSSRLEPAQTTPILKTTACSPQTGKCHANSVIVTAPQPASSASAGQVVPTRPSESPDTRATSEGAILPTKNSAHSAHPGSQSSIDERVLRLCAPDELFRDVMLEHRISFGACASVFKGTWVVSGRVLRQGLCKLTHSRHSWNDVFFSLWTLLAT